MKILASAAFRRFGLCLRTTDDPKQMAECLHNGWTAIVNVGGNHDSYIETVSNGGYYIE